jgi:hypothetical protein
MSCTTRGWTAAAMLAVVILGAQLTSPVAAADPETSPQPGAAPEDGVPPPPAGELRNVTYIARVDGVSRRAKVTYKGEGDQELSADPTMLPGRTFEANAVLPASGAASMQVSIDLPYSANLHCKILVDGTIVAQADDFVAPRLVRPLDDPSYGTLSCEAPVSAVALPPSDEPPADLAAPPDEDVSPPPAT